jgi:hypothetical protein
MPSKNDEQLPCPYYISEVPNCSSNNSYLLSLRPERNKKTIPHNNEILTSTLNYQNCGEDIHETSIFQNEMYNLSEIQQENWVFMDSNGRRVINTIKMYEDNTTITQENEYSEINYENLNTLSRNDHNIYENSSIVADLPIRKDSFLDKFEKKCHGFQQCYEKHSLLYFTSCFILIIIMIFSLFVVIIHAYYIFSKGKQIMEQNITFIIFTIICKICLLYIDILYLISLSYKSRLCEKFLYLISFLIMNTISLAFYTNCFVENIDSIYAHIFL